MKSEQAHSLRTRVYVDGYNFYYGCLKKSAHKWLDLRALAVRILANVPYERDRGRVAYEFVAPAVKYFTAPILPAFAKSNDSIVCQRYYHDALVGHLGDEIQLISGHYDARPSRAYRWEPDKPPRECDRVEIWKLEEKRSDVALALHTYSDAIRNEVDQIVLLTNDSDFAPAMQMIRKHAPTIIGLVAPIRSERVNVNAKLQNHAHWIRRHILDDEIACSQLPSVVPRPQGAVHKPVSWYPRPDLLTPIFEEAKRVRGSAGAARKWLNQPCAHLGNRIPISMCEQDHTAHELREYMKRYAQEFRV